MSAKHWDFCPQCDKSERERHAKLEEALKKSYGKISMEEYEKRKAELAQPLKVGDTLREDYQIGIGANFVFYVLYQCECQECGFRFEYKHEQKVPLTGKDSS